MTYALNPLCSIGKSESAAKGCHRYSNLIVNMDTAAALHEARLQRLEAELKATKRTSKHHIPFNSPSGDKQHEQKKAVY